MFNKIYYNAGIGGFTPRFPRFLILAALYIGFTHGAKQQARVTAQAKKVVEYEKQREEYWAEQRELALDYQNLEKLGLNTKYVYIPKGSRYLARFVRVSIAKTKIYNEAKEAFEKEHESA